MRSVALQTPMATLAVPTRMQTIRHRTSLLKNRRLKRGCPRKLRRYERCDIGTIGVRLSENRLSRSESRQIVMPTQVSCCRQKFAFHARYACEDGQVSFRTREGTGTFHPNGKIQQTLQRFKDVDRSSVVFDVTRNRITASMLPSCAAIKPCNSRTCAPMSRRM